MKKRLEVTPEERSLVFAGVTVRKANFRNSDKTALIYEQHMKNTIGLFIPDITRPPEMPLPEFKSYSKESVFEGAFQHIDTSHPDYVIIKERDKVIDVQLKHKQPSYLERILHCWLGIPFLNPYQIDINSRIYYQQEFV